MCPLSSKCSQPFVLMKINDLRDVKCHYCVKPQVRVTDYTIHEDTEHKHFHIKLTFHSMRACKAVG